MIIEDSSHVSKCQFGSPTFSSSVSMMAFTTQTEEKDKSGNLVRLATIQFCTWYLNELAGKNSFIADRGVVQTAANAGISGNAAANLKKQGITSATPIDYIGQFLEHTLMHEVRSFSDIGNCSSSHNEQLTHSAAANTAEDEQGANSYRWTSCVNMKQSSNAGKCPA